MRILIVSTFFPPLNSIASLRPYSWAKYWTLAGHDVTILTTEKEPNLTVNLSLNNPGFKVLEIEGFPKFLKKLKRGYRNQSSHSSTEHEKIQSSGWLKKVQQKCIKFFNFFRNKKGIFSSCRMPDFADLWIRPAIKAGRKQPPWDLIISTAGPYAVHIVAAALKRSGHSKRWVADYRDTWSNSCVYPGLFPFNIFEKFLENRLLQQADAITTISDPYATIFKKKYPQKKVITIENGFDPCDLENLDPTPIFPPDSIYRIVHTGTIYNQRNPQPLFEALAKMKQDSKGLLLLKNVEILFVGPNQAEVPEFIQRYDVGDIVKLCGFISRQDALRMQRDAHQLIFLPWNDPKNDGVLTGKLFEYLYSCTPIMAIGANAVEASQRLILEAKAGVILSNADSIKIFLESQLSNPKKDKNSIDADLLKRYDRRLLAMKLLQMGDLLG